MALTGTSRVPREHYETEDLLQRLIAEHPEILAGELISPDEPVRWLLVSREVGVPDAEGAGSRWSVDHLLIDQNAVPTFVEVKRSTDPRLRREVVGQMLDYAANAQTYWPVERIRSLAAEQHGGTESLDHMLAELLADGGEAATSTEAFWAKVRDNLASGTVRLLFVADELPRELRRVIEFLNQQMSKAEVLGVEICQYLGQGVRALVPRIVGHTEAIGPKNTPSVTTRKTSESAFMAACSDETRQFFRDVLTGARDRSVNIYWGTKGFSLRLPGADGQLKSIFYGYPPGANGVPHPHIQVFLRDVGEERAQDEARAAFLQAASFVEHGSYTLQLDLTPAVYAEAQSVLPVLWDLVGLMTQSNSTRSTGVDGA